VKQATVVAEYEGDFLACPYCPCMFARLDREDGDEGYDLKVHLVMFGVDARTHELRWKDSLRGRR